MNMLRQSLHDDAVETRTENGAYALSTTGSWLLDLYAVAGSIRHKQPEEVCAKFEKAYTEDPLRAIRLLFHIRDITEGLGERKTFRVILKRLADIHPEIVIQNMDCIPVYGRFDDLYELVGTRAENEMWKYMRTVYDADLENMNAGKPISLFAKWVANDTSKSRATEKLGKMTINKMGFKKTGYVECSKNLSRMRKYLNIPEIAIAAKDYESIEYSKVASKCLQKYRKAFIEHDANRFNQFISNVSKGTTKMNTGTITPGDIVHNLVTFCPAFSRDYGGNVRAKCSGTELAFLLEQWKNLKDILNNKNVITLLDTSGSMTSNNNKAIEQATGLAIYCSEHTTGAFADCFITFTDTPKFVELPHSASLLTKIQEAYKAPWGNNTDVLKAFKLILNTAIKNNIPQKDMPDSLLILSDMQFDRCDSNFTYNKVVDKMFADAGYKAPRLIFWCIRGEETYHCKANDPDVVLVSGESVNAFKHVIDSIAKTPYEAMIEVLDSPRYSRVTLK